MRKCFIIQGTQTFNINIPLKCAKGLLTRLLILLVFIKYKSLWLEKKINNNSSDFFLMKQQSNFPVSELPPQYYFRKQHSRNSSLLRQACLPTSLAWSVPLLGQKTICQWVGTASSVPANMHLLNWRVKLQLSKDLAKTYIKPPIICQPCTPKQLFGPKNFTG